MKTYKIIASIMLFSFSIKASISDEHEHFDEIPNHVAINIQALEEAFANNQGHISDTVADIKNRALLISNKITQFKTKYSQFEYGITAIQNMYRDLDDPETLRGRMNPTIPLRTIIFGAEILTGTACEILKCLSMLGITGDSEDSDYLDYSDSTTSYNSIFYGLTLSGLYALKAGLWGLDSYLVNKSKRSQKTILSSLQSDPKLREQVHNIETDIKNVKVNELYELTDDLAALLDGAELDLYNQKLFNRLMTIKTNTSNIDTFKKYFNNGGKIMSFLTGCASGILSSVIGKEAIPSSVITIVSCGADSIFDSISTTTSSKPIIQKYTNICEIIYICDYFVKELLAASSLSPSIEHEQE